MCKNLGWIRGADEENLGSRKNEGYVEKLGEYKYNAISTTVRQLSITGITKKAARTLQQSFITALASTVLQLTNRPAKGVFSLGMTDETSYALLSVKQPQIKVTIKAR